MLRNINPSIAERQNVHGHNQHKTNMEYEHKAAQILSDLHKHHTQLAHDKVMGRNKDKE